MAHMPVWPSRILQTGWGRLTHGSWVVSACVLRLLSSNRGQRMEPETQVMSYPLAGFIRKSTTQS